MRLLIAKYRHVFSVGLQSNIVYRWNFATRAAFSLIHLAFVFILWRAAYQGETTIGGFSLHQTLTYFITLLVLQFFIGAFNEDYEISEEIRSGLINQFLTKPINYFVYRFTIFVSARLVSGLLALIPLILALPLIGEYLTFPPETWRLVLGRGALTMLPPCRGWASKRFGFWPCWASPISCGDAGSKNIPL